MDDMGAYVMIGVGLLIGAPFVLLPILLFLPLFSKKYRKAGLILPALYFTTYFFLSLNGSYVVPIGGGASGPAQWLPLGIANKSPSRGSGRVESEPTLLAIPFSLILLIDQKFIHVPVHVPQLGGAAEAPAGENLPLPPG